MLRKADFRPVQKKDLVNPPSWIEVLLSPFNDMMQWIIDAFKGNISVSNLSTQTIDFNFTAPFVTTRFSKIKPDPVRGVLLVSLSRPDLSATGGNSGFDWQEEGNSIVIKGIYSIGAGQFNVKFLVLY